MDLHKAIDTFKSWRRSKSTRTIPPIPAAVWQKPSYFIAFGFGTGALPIAPGTFGTLIAIPFYLVLRQLTLPWYVGIVLVLTLASIWLCDKLSRDIQVHDHQGMNLDEIIGFLITMINAPLHWSWIVVGFILFRIFDIAKPWPINWADKNIGGGFGMIFDDVLAALYSCAVLQILAWFLA